jgi:TetR/AcrR family transcriptional regulator
LFSRDGFGGTTTKSIAAAAGISEAIILRHFATKEDLYTAILEHRAEPDGKDEWQAELHKCAARLDDFGLFKILISKAIAAYRERPELSPANALRLFGSHEIAKVSDQKVGMPGLSLFCAITSPNGQGAFRKCEPGVVVFALVGMARSVRDQHCAAGSATFEEHR